MKYLLISLLFVWRPCMGQDLKVNGLWVAKNGGVVILLCYDPREPKTVFVDSKVYKYNNGWHLWNHAGPLMDFDQKKMVIEACVDYITSLTDDRERRNDCLILDKIMQRINK